MVTDEEIDRFVSDNWENVQRFMRGQRDNIQSFSEFNKDMAYKTFKITESAAKLTKMKGKKLFAETLGTVTDPDIQKYLVSAGVEFITAMEAFVEASPIPDYVKSAVNDTKRNVRKAACRCNKDCPMKARSTVQEEAVE